MPYLSPEEDRVAELLAEAWNAFCELPEVHPMEREEFAHGIHRLQGALAAHAFMDRGDWKLPAR